MVDLPCQSCIYFFFLPCCTLIVFSNMGTFFHRMDVAGTFCSERINTYSNIS